MVVEKVKKTKKTKKMSPAVDKEKGRRKHTLTAMLNDKEYNAFIKYCNRYKINNKSKIIREMVFGTIMQDYMKDYPTLFDKQVLAEMVVERR
jgi:hypothetical protein